VQVLHASVGSGAMSAAKVDGLIEVAERAAATRCPDVVLKLLDLTAQKG